MKLVVIFTGRVSLNAQFAPRLKSKLIDLRRKSSYKNYAFLFSGSNVWI